MTNPPTAAVHFDPFSAEMHRDPYPTYAVLREHAPVYYNEERNLWALSRYDDVQATSRDWPTFSYASGVNLDNTGKEAGPGNFLDTDPPLHSVLRAVVRGAFVPKVLRQQMESYIRREVRLLLDSMVSAGGGDFAQDIAWTLPVSVAGEFLGYPVEDRPMIHRWANAFILREPGVAAIPTPALDAAEQARRYFADLVALRRAEPTADLISQIANATVDGEPIGDAAEGMVFLLFVASHDTTAGLLINGVRALAEHAEQLLWLRSNRAAIPDAIEEMLRFDPPLQNLKRTTTRDVTVRGGTIPQGATVALLYASANRDEQRYERAEEFDIARPRLRHLAFGEGIHHCLGAPLARLEAQIFLEVLLDVMPSFEIAGECVPLPNHETHTLLNLPLQIPCPLQIT
jgi:cytochrome P450